MREVEVEKTARIIKQADHPQKPPSSSEGGSSAATVIAILMTIVAFLALIAANSHR